MHTSHRSHAPRPRPLDARACPQPLRPLVLACVALLAPAAALADKAVLPTGVQVVAGQASVHTQGTQMTVTNSAGAVLNWQSFSIGAGQSVRFVQPGAQSQVLNRVLGRDPSHILGQLSSNGAVWLLNPYGVLFGAQARVDVASLVASTLSLGDADWLARRYTLAGGAGVQAAVVNQGEIRTTQGGRVLLVGGAGGVRNEGLVDAPQGQVALVAGATVDLADSTSPQIAVRVAAGSAEVANLGRVSAAGGRIDLQAAMVNQQGIVRADSLAAGPGGRVVLQASDTLMLGAGSETTARAAQGQGGRIELLGDRVGLLDDSQVDASGRHGGGEVYAGGGLQGRDAALPNARALYLGPGATVRADAEERGAGGRIVLWSNEATRAYGTLSARGGAKGGDGGFIETSGGWLDARPRSVRTDAPAGRAGTWLLDPNDITIGIGSTVHVTTGPVFTTTEDSAFINADDISTALTSGTSVTITTASGGANTQPGDITIANLTNIHSASAVPVTLTLNAARDIRMTGSSIASNGTAPLNVSFNAGTGGAGAIALAAGGVSNVVPSTIDTAGGSITLGGPSSAAGAPFAGAVGHGATPTAVSLTGTVLSAGSGTVSISGSTAVSAADKKGVSIGAGTSIGGRDIVIRGWAGADAAGNEMGLVSLGQISATHSLLLDGVSAVPAAAGSGNTHTGLLLGSGSLTQVVPANGPAASLTLSGRSVPQAGTEDAAVSIRGGANVQVGGGAAVLVTGSGGDIEFLGNQNFGGAGSLLMTGSSRWLHDGTTTAPSGGSVTIQAQGGVQFYGTMTGTPSSVQIQAENAGVTFVGNCCNGEINVGSAPVNVRARDFVAASGDGTAGISAGTIEIRATNVTLGNDASLAASGTGNALVIAGLTGNTTSFTHTAPSPALSTPNGRWLLYAATPDAGFSPGTLNAAYDFRQYNTLHPAAPNATAAGNGYLFALAPGLTVTGPDAQKAYDATATATLPPSNQLGVTGLRAGELLSAPPTVTSLDYATPNVHTGLPMVLALANDPQITDANGRPVFGYTVASSMLGSISALPLTITAVAVSDKFYDGTTAAVLSGGLLQGLLPGQTLNLSVTGQFADSHAGTAKPVNVNVTLSDGPSGALASNYTVTGTGSSVASASILPRPVTVGGLTANDKVYDGTTAATLSASTFTGLVPGETLTLAGSVQFDTRNVGQGKPVQGTVGLADGAGGLASNYVLTNPSAFSGQASIVPRGLVVSSARAADKVYDAGTAATVSGWVLGNVVPGDTVSVAAGEGRFADPNAGTGKTVTATATALTGTDAANYTLQVPGVQTQASIAPAPLTLVADQRSQLAGQPLPTLTGSVAGFVGPDTLASATTGTLVFTSPATTASPPGSYAINGSGLQAANYALVQAPGNATALRLRAPSLQGDDLVTQTPGPGRVLGDNLPQPQPSELPNGFALDVLPALSAGAPGFRALPLGTLPPGELERLLAARSAYKRQLFAEAIDALENSPGLPDLPSCQTVEQAAAGQCLVTEEIKPALRERVLRAEAATPPAAPPAASPPAAPTPAPAGQPGPVAAAPTPPAAAPGTPSPVAARAPARPLPLPPEALLRVPPPPAVRQAALPQIRRKLALVIGIDHFSDERIPTLANAIGDARAVGGVFEKALGYQVLAVRNGRKADIVRAFNQLAAVASPEDSVVVYYAGHGERVDKTGLGYWQPSDADASRPETWLSNSDIGKLMGLIGSRQVALISDSCFSGSLVSDERIRGSNQVPDPVALLARRAAVVMSSGGNEPVADSGKNGHSSFAWNLMRSLEKVPAWRPGGNVFEQVRFAVAREVPQRPQYGASRQGGHQSGADYLFEQRALDGSAP